MLNVIKRIDLYLLLLISCLFTACSDKASQLYVRDITIFQKDSGYHYTVTYFDFSSTEENYIKKEYVDENIYSAGMKAMADADYNYRLCENVMVSPELFNEDIDDVVNLINSLKVPVNTNIFCIAGEKQETKEITIDEMAQNPLYNLNVNNSNISGSFPVISEKDGLLGGILVSSGKAVKFLDNNLWYILSAVTKNKDNFSLMLRDDNIYVMIDKFSVYFSHDDNMLNINVNINIKDTKGVNNRAQNKLFIKGIVENEITNIISTLYNDVTISEMFNLYWYEKQQGRQFDDITIKVNVTV